NPARAEDIFRAVMKWDAENPPQTSPKYFCRLARFMVYGGGDDYTGQTIEQDLWPILYKAFRAEAENGFVGELRRVAADMPEILLKMNTGTGGAETPSPQDESPDVVPEDTAP